MVTTRLSVVILEVRAVADRTVSSVVVLMAGRLIVAVVMVIVPQRGAELRVFRVAVQVGGVFAGTGRDRAFTANEMD